MIMRTIILSVLAACSMQVAGQNISKEYLLHSLKRNNLDSLLTKYDKQTVIEGLNSIISSDTTNIAEIWYSESATDSSILKRSMFKPDTLYASFRLKAFFWTWLIIENKTQFGNKKAMLIDIQSKKKIFDYSSLNRIKYTNRIYNDSLLKELKDTYEAWYSLLKEKGLAYVTSQKVSSLDKHFKFEFFNTYSDNTLELIK